MYPDQAGESASDNDRRCPPHSGSARTGQNGAQGGLAWGCGSVVFVGRSDRWRRKRDRRESKNRLVAALHCGPSAAVVATVQEEHAEGLAADQTVRSTIVRDSEREGFERMANCGCLAVCARGHGDRKGAQ